MGYHANPSIMRKQAITTSTNIFRNLVQGAGHYAALLPAWSMAYRWSIFSGSITTLIGLFALPAVPVSADSSLGEGKPRLVVLIIIDQLRGDMLWRFRDRFGEGGFNYLIDHGVSYTYAHYRHSSTRTAPGHASLVTGASPAQHGIVGNAWYDLRRGEKIYSVADDRYPIIGGTENDQTGRSPQRLRSSTIGDELILATNGHSRVFSVSIKDRAAIMLGGHLGKAFWYSKNTGQFVTSRYYYDTYPDWVETWHTQQYAERYRQRPWKLLKPINRYIYRAQNDRLAGDYASSIGIFPHRIQHQDSRAGYAALRATPMADVLTLDFIKALMVGERLGQGAATDLLSVSFSASDYIGHRFGPNSLESEDNLLRLDRTLSNFLRFIDLGTGLDKTLLVLSADHGIDAIPELKRQVGLDAGRLDRQAFLKTINAKLQAIFKVDNLLAAFSNESLYLDPAAVANHGLELPIVERAVAEIVLAMPHFSHAITRTDLLEGRIAKDPILAKLQHSFHPQRSGNVLIVLDPSWQLQGESPPAATHGSPYTYDTHVPILFAGPGIPRKQIHRSAGPEDIAPTLAVYLHIPAPPRAIGTPLHELMQPPSKPQETKR